MLHLEKNGLLSHYPYNFRRNRYTELAVTYFTDFVREQAENGHLTGAVFTDLSKAFDTISHSGLLRKLPFYGVRGVELEWFTDYLFGRLKIVQYKAGVIRSKSGFHGCTTREYFGPRFIFNSF